MVIQPLGLTCKGDGRDGVDTTRTTTNNVYEIWQMLGIEAARTALVKEITNTLEEQGLEVDTRHIMLVADLMTSKGYLQQIGRHALQELRHQFLQGQHLKSQCQQCESLT
jgi:DNA-directed RNA polymerase beta' subunit